VRIGPTHQILFDDQYGTVGFGQGAIADNTKGRRRGLGPDNQVRLRLGQILGHGRFFKRKHVRHVCDRPDQPAQEALLDRIRP